MTTNHLIVGGGVYGTALARELAVRGEGVTLLEAEAVAAGASGGLGKRGVRANGRDRRELPLMALAYDIWPDIEDAVDAGYERTGHLRLYERGIGGVDGGFEAAPARKQLQNGLGVETELLDADELREIEPGVSDDVVGALYCPNDGVADHTATTRGLAAAAERAGADVHEGATVRGFDVNTGRVTAVRTGDDRIPVDGSVVLLSNTHVPDVLDAEFGVSLPVWTVLPQVIATEPLAEVTLNHLIGHDSRKLALKEVPGDRVMISGGWRGERDGSTGRGGRTVPEQVRGNVEVAGDVFPALRDVPVEEADASRPESVAVDAVPIIDTVPGARNLIYGTGWSGHGFAIAPAVARLLARWVVEGHRPSLLEPFGTDRFTDGGRIGDAPAYNRSQ